MTLSIEGTEKTPQIAIAENGILQISGRSYPEDLHAFWDAIIDQIENQIESGAIQEIEFDVNYHNSGTTRIFVNLIKFIESCGSVDKFSICWKFDEDDEQTEEQGEDYEMLCNKITFTMQSYEG